MFLGVCGLRQAFMLQEDFLNTFKPFFKMTEGKKNNINIKNDN